MLKKFFYLILAFSLLLCVSVKAEKVKMGLSAFQDVYSVFVGIEQGYWEAEGIELELTYSDWGGTNELGVADKVDVWATSDADVVLHNARGIDSTLAFPMFYFAGSGLMFDPNVHPDWTTYNEFFDSNGGNVNEAIKSTLIQVKGTKVAVAAGGAQSTTFIQMIERAGLNQSDFNIIDMTAEDMPPALLSGSIDIQISGIPQRLAVLNKGMKTLMDQTSLPDTVAHGALGAKRSWINANFETAKKIQKVILKTLAYIKQNPDDSFPIIVENLKKRGTPYEAEWLYGVWDNMEFFVNGVDWYNEKVVATNGGFYWKDRFESLIVGLQSQDKIPDPYEVPLEDLNYGLKIVSSLEKEGFKTSMDN